MRRTQSSIFWGYVGAFVVIALATAIGWLLFHGLRWPEKGSSTLVATIDVLMLYLLGVLIVAVRFTRGAAVLASVLAVAAFDFCFVPPFITFAVADKQYMVTFAVMLLTALTISTLTHRVRMHAAAAREGWERAETEFLRNTMLSGVSHDLRTPLAAIIGAASTLIETGEKLTPAARAEMLDTISEQAERMERWVNNMLEMTRLEARGDGELALHREVQHIQEVLGSALRSLDKRLTGRSVTTQIPDDLPLAYIDDVAMVHVLVNLIQNAIDHTPPGSPIDISAMVQQEDLVIEIADRGPGLPPGAELRVFEKFFHACRDRSGGSSGMGLGLAICKGLVEAHGGSVSAVNRSGGGEVFRVRLPCAKSIPGMN